MVRDEDDMEDDVNDDASDPMDDEQEGGVFRWMSVVVVLLAISGFFGLAWYAYKSGGEVVDEKDAELIAADTTPVKEAPANPGGMPIPNQDKTVYGLVGGKQDDGKVVEHILASPETPVARTEEPDTGTWMSDQVKDKLKSVEEEKNGLPPAPPAPATKENAVPAQPKAALEKPAEEATKAEQFKPAKEHVLAAAEETKPAVKPDAKDPIAQAEALETKKAEVKPAPAPKVEAPKVETPKAEAPKEDAKTLLAQVKKLDEKTSKPAVAPLPPVEKKVEVAPPAIKTPAGTAPSGTRAQLGAFKSTDEADGQWKKISKKFASSLGGKDHYIVRADLGDKGVFYRLQVAPFGSTKDVESFCMDLVSEGQGCFPAKGK